MKAATVRARIDEHLKIDVEPYKFAFIWILIELC